MSLSLDHPIGERFFGLRLDTLIRLRWLAISGQTLAIVFVEWVLGFSLPIGAYIYRSGARLNQSAERFWQHIKSTSAVSA